jgi:chromatin remodeling complex protein RSC6
MATTTIVGDTAQMMEACEDATQSTETVQKKEVTMTDVFEKLDELQNTMRWLQRYGKQFMRQQEKIAMKPKKRKQAQPTDENGEKKPRTGFATPVKVDERLADFLGMDRTEEIARTEVTKRITSYIKQHDLQLAENRKQFTVDEALAHVLGVENGTTTDWFRLQKFLSKLLFSAKSNAKANENSTEDSNENAPAPAPTPAPAPPSVMEQPVIVTAPGEVKKRKIKRPPPPSGVMP